jgi:hypothetical protein
VGVVYVPGAVQEKLESMRVTHTHVYVAAQHITMHTHSSYILNC